MGNSPRRGSLPPNIVLEVLRITEAEMDLRTLTRDVEQARRGQRTDEYHAAVEPVAEKQRNLGERTEKVIEEIKLLPDAEQEFGKELMQLAKARSAMEEAEERLDKPDSGPVAVAAESEAIEWLLLARRMGGGGGGGGSTPGGGGGGTTNVSALALAGRGDAPLAKADLRSVEQATGTTEDEVPAELRSALDRYFAGLERF
jgi:hypothetical protein